MCPSLVEVRIVTSEIRCRKKEQKKEKKKEKGTAIKHKPFGIAMPCGQTRAYSASMSAVLFI